MLTHHSIEQVCGPALAITCHTLWHQMLLITQPVVPSIVGINIGKYIIFHRPDEAMTLVMVKAFPCLRNILLFRNLKDFILLRAKPPVCAVFGVQHYSFTLYMSLRLLSYALHAVMSYSNFPRSASLVLVIQRCH